MFLIPLLSSVSFCSAQHEAPTYSAQLSDPETEYSAMSPTRQLNRTLFNPALYKRVQEVWFGNVPWGAKQGGEEATKRWFQGGPDEKAKFDKECYNEFGSAIESISPSRYSIKGLSDSQLAEPFVQEIAKSDGEESTKTALSLVILLDQIPRNLYRTNETLKVVYEHYDPIAVALARHITSTMPRLDLNPSIKHSVPYRQWFYLPLMHSEKLADHETWMRIQEESERESKGMPEILEELGKSRKFEEMHVDIIKKFGRYPHRNGCLGRESTEDEGKHMEEGGQTFGVVG